MQKRRVHVGMIAFVIIAIAGMVVYNALYKPNSTEEQQQNANESVSVRKVTEQDREAEKQKLLDVLKKDSSSTSPGSPHKPGLAKASDMGEPEQMAKEPTILMAKWQAYHPTPSDASTATHWYDEASRSAKVAEENAHSRD